MRPDQRDDGLFGPDVDLSDEVGGAFEADGLNAAVRCAEDVATGSGGGFGHIGNGVQGFVRHQLSMTRVRKLMRPWDFAHGLVVCVCLSLWLYFENRAEAAARTFSGCISTMAPLSHAASQR